MSCIVEFGLALSFAALPAPQDLTLRGVKVTAGADVTWNAKAIEVRGGRVLAADADPATTAPVVDFGGRGFVFPGFVDAHAHLIGLGRMLEEVDLVGTESYAEVVEMVRQRAARAEPGSWILGRGWDQNDWAAGGGGGVFPTHHDLSAAVPDHPVLLTRVDGHAALANAAAMRAAGLDASTESPSGGEILRAEGEPTGVLIDRAMALVSGHVPAPSREQVERHLMAAQRECLRLGLTCVHDAGMDPATLDVLRALHTKGRWALRVYAMLPAAATEAIRKGPWQTPDRVLTVRAVKGYADGALGSRGAALLEPYADRPGSRGLMLTPPKALAQLAQLCADHGFQLCVHAIGDRANREVLRAYAGTEFRTDPREARFRIEHAQVVHPDDFVKFKQHGVIPSVQPTHLTSDMPWATERLGKERIAGTYAWREFLKLGLPLPFGSDFPVEGADPLLGWYAAATTKSATGREPEWRPEQKLSRREILRGFTADAAYAAFAEHEFGTIAPGKIADFTVFDRDLMTCDAEELREARVLMVVIGGRVVFQVKAIDPTPPPISATWVKQVLDTLASDEFAGRDSPSPELERAAEFIASAFGAVGVWPLGDDGTFFHRYKLDGVNVDTRGLRISIERENAAPLVLEPERDVRLWLPGRPFENSEVECDVTPLERSRRRRSRRTKLMICPADAPIWSAAAGRRQVIQRRMRGSTPTLLVREGLLQPGTVDARLTIPEARKVKVPLRNVVAKMPGGDLAEEYVLVTAHYDHVGIGASAGDNIFNGADDNATGTTAVVTLAESIARSGKRLKRSVVFVCFSAEEKGLRGSRAFVERPPVPLEQIVAVVNLEMLGRPEAGKSHYAWITGADLSDFADIAAPVFRRNGIELVDFPMASQLFNASDNRPFAAKGVVAHSISAGHLHQDYHRPGDQVEKIEIGHMTAVIGAIGDFVIELANRDGRPSFNAKGKRALGF